MPSLQEMTDMWGKQYAKDREWTFEWSVSTDFGSHEDELKRLYSHAKPATVGAQDINFIPVESLPIVLQVIDQEVFRNTLSRELPSSEIDLGKKETQGFTWSITESLDVGVKVTGSVGLPLIAKGSVELNTSLDLSSTQSKSDTKEEDWTKKVQTGIIPSMTKLTLTMMLGVINYEIKFTADVAIDGVAWFKVIDPKSTAVFYVYFGLSTIIGQLDPTGESKYFFPTSTGIIARSSGVLKGSHGTYTDTLYEGSPITSNQNDDNAPNSKGIQAGKPLAHPERLLIMGVAPSSSKT